MWSCRMFLASEEPLYKTTIDGKGEEGGRTTENYNTQVTKGKKAKGFCRPNFFIEGFLFSLCGFFLAQRSIRRLFGVSLFLFSFKAKHLGLKKYRIG